MSRSHEFVTHLGCGDHDEFLGSTIVLLIMGIEVIFLDNSLKRHPTHTLYFYIGPYRNRLM